MKSTRKLLTLLLLVSIVVLSVSTIGITLASLNVKSDELNASFEMYHTGITLNENGKKLAWRNYENEAWNVSADAELLTEIKGNIRYGVTYPEELTVTNSGQIDEYVRVTIYKYWKNEKGEKDQTLDPNLINIKLTDDKKWVIDKEYSGEIERTVMYYTLPLKGTDSMKGGETTPAFALEFSLDPTIKTFVNQKETVDEKTGYITVTNTYKYDGKELCIEVQADAVQTHNAEDAIRSAWGRKVKIAGDGTLSLE